MARIIPECIAGDDDDPMLVCGKLLCCAAYDEERDWYELTTDKPCDHCANHYGENVE